MILQWIIGQLEARYPWLAAYVDFLARNGVTPEKIQDALFTVWGDLQKGESFWAALQDAFKPFLPAGAVPPPEAMPAS